MLTTAFGFLLSGPIESIDTNVQEVVRAITCLYNQVCSDFELQYESCTEK